MADLYDVLPGAYEDVQFLGGTTTLDVLVTPIRTKPHGIYVEVAVPMTAFRKQGANAVSGAAAGWAAAYESMANLPHVGSVQWGQQHSGGQVENVAIYTVLSASGNSAATLTLPAELFEPAVDAKPIAALSKQLDELEAL